MSPTRIVLIVVVMVAGLGASVGLALLGEPQSVWLWRDMAGLID